MGWDGHAEGEGTRGLQTLTQKLCQKPCIVLVSIWPHESFHHERLLSIQTGSRAPSARIRSGAVLTIGMSRTTIRQSGGGPRLEPNHVSPGSCRRTRRARSSARRTAMRLSSHRIPRMRRSRLQTSRTRHHPSPSRRPRLRRLRLGPRRQARSAPAVPVPAPAVRRSLRSGNPGQET